MAKSSIDIKKQAKVYRGTPDTPQGVKMSPEESERVSFIRDRFVLMAQSKSVLENKFQLAKQLYDIFRQHLIIGDDWNTPFQFPNLFGAIQRKLSDLIDNMPEVKINAAKSSAMDFSIATQATYEHVERETATQREKARALSDTLFYGIGILFEGYNRDMKYVTPIQDDELYIDYAPSKEEICLFDGLVSERVDPRDFFIDESANIFQDETGLQGARDCIRRRIYPYSSFIAKFKNKKFKNVDMVIPTGWGSDSFGFAKQPYQTESNEQKTSQKYVSVFEYWNWELDMMALVANGIEIYCGASPFQHKRLPFVLYYNYRRDDSVWGISETEILAPYIYADEQLINLHIINDKLQLQPAIAVSGDVMWNTEESQLQPGAIFTVRGLNGGEVGKSFAPLTFGGIPESSFQVRQQIEDNKIQATGDDTRALYSNPDQLATQTLTKREQALKRIKANILQNTFESERTRALLRISNMMQFYAKPYLNIDGQVTFRRIRIEGYNVKQANEENKPEFVQSYGARGYFSLNPRSFGSLDDLELEVVDAETEEELKGDEIKNLMQYLQSITQLLPIQPQISQSLDVIGLMKEIAKKMQVNYYEVFPTPAGEDGSDEIDLMIDLLMLGQQPEIDPDLDCIMTLQRISRFMDTDIYKNSPKKVHDAIATFITSLTINVPQTIQKKLATIRQYRSLQSNRLANMESPQGVSNLQSGQGFSNAAGRVIQTASQRSPIPANTPVPAPTGVSARLGFGPSQPNQGPTQTPQG